MKRSALGNRRQAGFTFWSIVFYVLVLGSAIVLALRIAPSYLEYMTVRDIMERAVGEWDPDSQGTRQLKTCLLYTSPSPRDATLSRMPSSA